MMRDERGSTTIETLILAPLVGLLLLGAFAALYLSFAKIWLHRSAREAAVCLASPTPPSRCRVKLERTLALGLPFGRVEILALQSDRFSTRASVQVQFNSKWMAREKNDGHRIVASATYKKPIYFPRGRT